MKFWPAPAIGPTACLTMSSRPVWRRLVTVTTAGSDGSVPITTGLGAMSTSSQPSGGSSSVMVQVEPLAMPSITSNAAPWVADVEVDGVVEPVGAVDADGEHGVGAQRGTLGDLLHDQGTLHAGVGDGHLGRLGADPSPARRPA